MLIEVHPRFRDLEDNTDRAAWMWCPGCEDLHRIILDGTGAWGWNGSLGAPTFTPSILVRGGTRRRPGDGVCHSFVTDGQWNYLGDCTHALAGQQVPMVPIPDGLLGPRS